MYKDAIDAYQKSADLNSEDKDIWRFLGTAFLNIGDYERAEKSFENANKITPLNTDIFTGWGMAYMKQKNYTEAREKFINAIKINRYNFSALFFSAMCESRLGMLDMAEAKLKFLTSVKSNDINCYEYANIKFLKGNLADAEFWAKKSIEFNSKIVPAYTLLIKIFGLKHDLGKIQEYFEQGVKNGLEGDNLNENYGIALLNCAKFKDAKYFLLQAYGNNLNSETITEALLTINTAIGDDGNLPFLKDKLIKLNPENRILKAILAIDEAENSNLQNGINELKKCIDNLPYKFVFMQKLAKLYISDGNFDKASEYFENSINENLIYIECYLAYAKFLEERNELAQAQRKLRKGLKYIENDTQLLNLLFHISYLLVKDNVCEYNIKEAIGIAGKITNPDLFEYKDELNELTEMLEKVERDKN